MVVRERKTGNTCIVFLIPWAREVLAEVAELVGAKTRLHEPVVGRLSRQRAWEVLKRTAEELGWHEHISTHSLRKAFCDFVYEQTRDPIMAARLTGHANPAHLLRYIRRVPEAEMAVWRRMAKEARGFNLQCFTKTARLKLIVSGFVSPAIWYTRKKLEDCACREKC